MASKNRVSKREQLREVLNQASLLACQIEGAVSLAQRVVESEAGKSKELDYAANALDLALLGLARLYSLIEAAGSPDLRAA